MSLVVVGSVGVDTITTPFGRAEAVPGGSAVYFSLASSLFTEVRLVANVGNDFPEEPWSCLRERGVDLEGLQRFSDRPTFRWSGSYEGDMSEARTDLCELNVLVEPFAIPPAYTGTPYVFLANTDPRSQLAALETLGGEPFVFADTMNFWLTDEHRPALLALLNRIDGLICNDQEIRELTAERNLIAAARAALSLGPQMVVVKKGEHGSLLITADGEFGLPAFPTTTVVDPTGAGDSFAGGFLGSLAASPDRSPDAVRLALAYGTVTASVTVESFSIDGLAAADRELLEDRLAVFRNFTRF